MDMTDLEERPLTFNLPSFSFQATYGELSMTSDPIKQAELAQRVIDYLETTADYEFENALQIIVKGSDKTCPMLLAQSSFLVMKIMSHFVTLAKEYRRYNDDSMQYRFLFILSILAELVRKNPKFQISLDRAFLANLFEIELDQIPQSARGRLLAILAVLYSNIGKQSRRLRELKMQKRLKESILGNYPHIQQLFTLKLFNKCIVDLQLKRVVIFSVAQLQRYGIKKALMKTLGHDNASLISKYLDKIFAKNSN